MRNAFPGHAAQMLRGRGIYNELRVLDGAPLIGGRLEGFREGEARQEDWILAPFINGTRDLRLQHPEPHSVTVAREQIRQRGPPRACAYDRASHRPAPTVLARNAAAS